MKAIAAIIFIAGWALIPIGAVLALLLGTQFELIPGIEGPTGYVYEEAIMHPFRWYYGVATFIFMTISGLVLVGIGAIIQQLENQ